MQIVQRSAPPWERLVVGAAVLGVVALLITARWLEPSPVGYGTHQQLGLPPCSSVLVFGARCPACGMTTAWAWALRGDLESAARANLGGALLVLIALAYIPVFCYFIARGRWSRHGWLAFSLAAALSLAMVVACLQWAWRSMAG
jgi:hypothetical protein